MLIVLNYLLLSVQSAVFSLFTHAFAPIMSSQNIKWYKWKLEVLALSYPYTFCTIILPMISACFLYTHTHTHAHTTHTRSPSTAMRDQLPSSLRSVRRTGHRPHRLTNSMSSWQQGSTGRYSENKYSMKKYCLHR